MEKTKEKMSLAEMLKLPQDAVYGDTVMKMIGKSKVIIENYRSILIYSDTIIKVQAKSYRVSVGGKRLRIRYYDKDEMEIYGRIETVTFE